jgi:COP9 signalosome complex subunit 6
MLSRRLALLRTYLDNLPPSYLTDPSLPVTASQTAGQAPIDHSILRSISATLARINILSPPDTAAFTLESQQEASDVQLVGLLSAMTNSIAAAKDFGMTSHIIETVRNQNSRKAGFPGMQPGMSGMGGMGDLRSGDGSAYFEDIFPGDSERMMKGLQSAADRWS